VEKIKNIILHTHSGLGDTICLYGMVKYLLENTYENIYLVCKDTYLDSIAHLYKDDDNVHIISMPNPGNDMAQEMSYAAHFSETENIPIIRVGFENLQQSFHYSQFFNQLSVPYESSWNNFPHFDSTDESKELYKSLDLDGKEYALLINENSYGKSDLKVTTDLHKVTLHKTDLGTGVFDWLDVIRNASVIHSVGTGPFHLVDRLDGLKAIGNLYFHNVRDDYKTISTRLEWNLIEYEQTSLGYWRSDT